jgi:nitrite reductase/ring-hydroxylating ferredoxin subunit/CDGSH-type Zn-finger protein
MTHDLTLITPEDNGPLHVRGHFSVVLPGGRTLETDGETWLCRCGASRDKPFCDGSHERIGFRASEAEVSPAHLAAPDQSGAADGFVVVARTHEIGEGDLLGVEVDGRPVVLGRVDGVIHAVGGLCPHQGARLADGDLDGRILACPLHNGALDITTGLPARLPVRTAAPRYEVRVEDGAVLVSRQPLAAPIGQAGVSAAQAVDRVAPAEVLSR